MVDLDRILERPSDPHLRDCLVQHREIAERVEALFCQLRDDQLGFIPGRGRWSILGNIEHLVRVGRDQAAVIGAVIRRGIHDRRLAIGEFRSVGWGQWFIELVKPPYRLRMPTLKRYVADPVLEATPVRREFTELQASLAGLIAAADGLDLVGLRGRLPYLPVWNPSLSLGQWFTYVAAHECRHLDQVERIRSNSRFPR